MNDNELKQEVDKLWNCYNGMMLDFMQFGAEINRATASNGEVYFNEAKGYLAKIEEVIKRYHENRPQKFEG